MEVEATRLSGLAIDRRAVEAERGAVIEEWVHDIEENPEALLEEHVRARLWAATPYGHPVVSDSEKTVGIAVQDIRDFYDTWYEPNIALLIASGRIDPRDLMEHEIGIAHVCTPVTDTHIVCRLLLVKKQKCII